MRPPDCHDHGRLVLDLALGRLDDADAATAESVRLGCPACSSWWRTELEGSVAVELDAVLRTSFASFALPARRRLPRWLPVAAAATLAAGTGLLWHQQRSEPPVLTQVEPTAVVAETFDGDRDGNGTVDISDIGFAVHVDTPSDAIFTDTLDDGDLTGWTPHT